MNTQPQKEYLVKEIEEQFSVEFLNKMYKQFPAWRGYPVSEWLEICEEFKKYDDTTPKRSFQKEIRED